MKAARTRVPTEEPIGIIISPGASPETAPARFAYVWAPPPVEDTPEEKHA